MRNKSRTSRWLLGSSMLPNRRFSSTSEHSETWRKKKKLEEEPKDGMPSQEGPSPTTSDNNPALPKKNQSSNPKRKLTYLMKMKMKLLSNLAKSKCLKSSQKVYLTILLSHHPLLCNPTSHPSRCRALKALLSLKLQQLMTSTPCKIYFQRWMLVTVSLQVRWTSLLASNPKKRCSQWVQSAIHPQPHEFMMSITIALPLELVWETTTQQATYHLLLQLQEAAVLILVPSARSNQSSSRHLLPPWKIYTRASQVSKPPMSVILLLTWASTISWVPRANRMIFSFHRWMQATTSTLMNLTPCRTSSKLTAEEIIRTFCLARPIKLASPQPILSRLHSKQLPTKMTLALSSKCSKLPTMLLPTSALAILLSSLNRLNSRTLLTHSRKRRWTCLPQWEELRTLVLNLTCLTSERCRPEAVKIREALIFSNQSQQQRALATRTIWFEWWW